jgi:thiol-disulfide isomerase/thioredoxin
MNSENENNTNYIKVGDSVPSFTTTTLEGKIFNIDFLKGKVALLNFWTTWCPACHDEMPKLQTDIWNAFK